MNERRSNWLLLLLPLIGGYALAQADSDLQKRAADAYQDQQWSSAADAYREILDADASDGRSWYRLGVSLRHLGKYSDAADALASAEEAGVPASFTKVEIAKAHAAAGDSDKAIEALETAVGSGYSNIQALQSDPDLAPLNSNPKFATVIEAARRNSMPCEYNDHFNDFNFWVGEWDVSDQASTQAYGSNRIEKIESNCLIVEHWASATGGTGTSMNYFDPSTGLWNQKWVSGGGLIIDISGGLENDAMVLTGTAFYVSNGQKFPFRGTWTPLDDGRVRQFFEQSSDDGETWSPWFDGYYARKTDD